MNCEMCGNSDRHEWAILPIRQPDGRLDTIMCWECAQMHPAYCSKHGRPHLGFMDQTTACIDCIEELVKSDGERVAGLFAGTINNSPRKTNIEADIIEADINEWLEMITLSLPSTDLGDLTLAVKFIQTPRSLNISRAIFTRAQRLKTSPEAVIKEVAEKGAGVILPPVFGING